MSDPATGDITIKNVPVDTYIPTNNAQQSFLTITLDAKAVAGSADELLDPVESEAKTIFSITCENPPTWNENSIDSLQNIYTFPAYDTTNQIVFRSGTTIVADPYCPLLGYNAAGANKDDF